MLTESDNELTVVVHDPSDSGPQPQGKQRVSAITKPGGDHCKDLDPLCPRLLG